MAGPTPFISPGRIAGYEVQAKLGAGGMGVVYKALDLKLNRTVALKFLSEEEVTAADRERLLREARASSALDHPNIATVHTVEETADGRAFIVMGYYQGETLAEKIRHSPLQPAHAVNFAMQIAAGLQHAHARNITHRDIKPSNVLITDDGTAKILDFGLARAHGPAASTESRSLSGTLLYMSPEQVQGKPLDERTDIWAFGVVLYQMLTGRLPFFTDNAASTILAILNSSPAPMPEVAEELQLIIMRALSKTPAARYRNCAEMIRDLEKVAVDDRAPTLTISRSDLQRQLRSAAHSAAGIAVVSPRRMLWLTIALCLAVGMSIAIAIGFTPLRSRIFGPQEKHIAVLPFATNSKDAAVQSLADGLMESITGRLSNLNAGGKSLWVVPASQIRRRKLEDAEAARKETGATLIVQGAVQQLGNQVRLTLNLVDTKSMRQLGSIDVSGTTDKVAAVEEEAIDRLASLMNLTAAGSSGKGASVTGAAYESYLQGRGLLLRFDIGNNLDGSIAQFEKAVAADPGFALAYNGLAEAYWNKYRLENNEKWIVKAEEYGKQGLQLDDQSPTVYITLGNIHDTTGKRDLALSEFQKALKLEPNNADALLGLARAYEHMGQNAKAEETFRQGAALRPDYWGGYHELGFYYYRQRNYEAAAREWQRVVQLAPDSAPAHANYATVLMNMPDRVAEAEAEFKTSIRLKPLYSTINNLGNFYFLKRRWADALEMYDRARKLNDVDYRVWANCGLAYDWLGQHEKALEYFRHARQMQEKSILLKPDDPVMQSSLGLLYARENMRDKAIPHLQAALARAPKHPSVLADTAEAYVLLGDRSQGIALARRAVAAGVTTEELDRNQNLRGLQAEILGQAEAPVKR